METPRDRALRLIACSIEVWAIRENRRVLCGSAASDLSGPVVRRTRPVNRRPCRPDSGRSSRPRWESIVPAGCRTPVRQCREAASNNVARKAHFCVTGDQRSMEPSCSSDSVNGRVCYRLCRESLERSHTRRARMSESG